MQARSRHQFPKIGSLSASSWRSRLSALRRTQKPAERPAEQPAEQPAEKQPTSILPLLDFPNELILIIAEYLGNAKHVYYLLLTNRRLAHLLTPLLHKHAVQNKRSINALHWAAWRGHEGLVKLLIQQKGFDVNNRNPTYLNWTALHWAFCRRNHPRTVQRVLRVLLENGADTTIKDRLQITVLHQAVQARARCCLKLLLENGATSIIDAAEENTGETALHMAVENDRYGDLWGPLLHMGADVSARDRKGRTPLHAAARVGNDWMVRALLDKGAGVNERDQFGRTPLHSMRYITEDIPMVKALLDAGADVNLQNLNGKTPLHIAAECDCKPIIEMMLQEGAKMEIEDLSGVTPLSILEDKIKWLKQSPKWKLHVRLRDRALIKQHKDIAQLLKSYRLSDASKLAL